MNVDKDDFLDRKQISDSDLSSKVDNVIAEAKATAAFLDAMSGNILKLETALKNYHANFSFKLIVKTGEKEKNLPIEERHKAFSLNVLCSSVVGVHSVKYWSLAWGPIEDGSKTYRLLLMCEEQEICWLGLPEGEYPYDLPSKIILRKALLETSIGTRREYSVYMNKFLSEFEAYIKACRDPVPAGTSYKSVINWEPIIKKVSSQDSVGKSQEAVAEKVSYQDPVSEKVSNPEPVAEKSLCQRQVDKKTSRQKVVAKKVEEGIFADEPPFQDDLPF